MSLNNSVLTKASKPKEYQSDAVSFRTKEGGYVQAVKYYGVQRGRPIFSALPNWLYDVWLERKPGPITAGNETFCISTTSDVYLSISKENYIVMLPSGVITEVAKETFENNCKPVMSVR